MGSPTGQRLLRYDRRLGVRFVAGADEAGRGSLAGPLVVAGVLLRLRRRCTAIEPGRSHCSTIRSRSIRTRARCSSAPCSARRHRCRSASSRPVTSIDTGCIARTSGGLRAVLGRSRAARRDLRSSTGSGSARSRRPHRAVVDGDTRSAAIAAASIVAKVTRDRIMRRLDALHPRYGFSRHVGYITPAHSAAVRAHGALRAASAVVRREVLRASEVRARARCGVNSGERRALVALPAARLPDPRRRTFAPAATSST